MEFKKPDPDLNCPCKPNKPCGLHKIQFYAIDKNGNIASKNKIEWINKKEGTLKVTVSK